MMKLEIDQDLERLLEYLKQARHFDFTGYKRMSLKRRIDKRLEQVGIDNYSDYVDYLEVHPDEFVALFNTVLINVTAFFRDAAAWDFLEHDVAPCIVAQKGANDPIRIWCAGCASGEEAYTLAILFAEALGIDEFRQRVKIYATDIDEEALARARHATYGAKDLSGVPERLIGTYFEPVDGKFVFRKDFRRSVIFGRHDLLRDAPISRIDLLSCRNCLMYFNTEAQSRILRRFHFAMQDAGFFFLGRAELLFAYTNMFTVVDLKRRVFGKLTNGDQRDKGAFVSPRTREDAGALATRHARICEAAFDASPVATLVVDLPGYLVTINERARAMFSLALHDVGRPIRDLEISYRPVELRSYIEQAQSERRTLTVKDISWPLPGGEPRWLDVQVSPLLGAESSLLGTIVSLSDVTRFKHLQAALEHTNQELETAYEELQSTNEELETTNEELQSTVEELETTNEELQSTNEELETMNQEMQSTNEELQTVNDNVRQRSDELNHVNVFLEAILTSLRGGVIVVDMDSRVQIWNRRSEDMWGLRSDEVRGRNLMMLDFGLPVEGLKRPLRACLTGENEMQETLLKATNRRGKPILCRITSVPLVGVNSEVQGAVLVMDEIRASTTDSAAPAST